MNKILLNKFFLNLSRIYIDPKSELKYINKFTFLIAVILSAQATDVSVNKATKQLFKIAKKPQDILLIGERKLKSYIKTIGLFNMKAKNIIALSKILINKFDNKMKTHHEYNFTES